MATDQHHNCEDGECVGQLVRLSEHVRAQLPHLHAEIFTLNNRVKTFEYVQAQKLTVTYNDVSYRLPFGKSMEQKTIKTINCLDISVVEYN